MDVESLITSRALSGRKCLITGASGRLGDRLARTFWQAGASLLLTGRNGQCLTALAKELQDAASGDQLLATVECNLANAQEVDTLVPRARQHLGTLTILVNNAGTLGPIGPLHHNDWIEWEQAVRVDLLAPARLCAMTIPLMLEQGYGKIINISGGGATSPRPNFTAYAVAKTGLVRLTEIIAYELKGSGIDSNCIAPGAMNSAMLDEVLRAGAGLVGEAEFSKAQQQVCSGGASPLRAARLAVFLASSASDGINGRLISAVWDPWEDLFSGRSMLENEDMYTLRRIVSG